MTIPDRILRALFVAAAVGIAWGIRGSFGHAIGASYPGAVLALAFCYVSGQDALKKWMPVLAAVTGLLISIGGNMSYGVLHGYAQSDTFVNYTYGLFTLFLEGGAWGIFGCAAMGLLLEQRRPALLDCVGGVIIMIASGVILQIFIVNAFKFHVDTRSNDVLGYTGASVALLVLLYVRKLRLALHAAALGYLGFGLGMSGGRVLGNISNVMQVGGMGPFTINHWNVMETSVGLIAGFVVAFGMLGYDFREPNDDHSAFRPLAALCGAYAVFGIPLLHRLTRVNEKQVGEWVKALTASNHADPEAFAHTLQGYLSALCVIALIGAVAWLVMYFREEQQFPWLPVLTLTGVMLLFQDFFSLYFYEPRAEHAVDTRTFYWVLFTYMVGFVIYQTLNSGPEDESVGIDAKTKFRTWLVPVIGLLAFVVCVFVSGFVNGDETMKSACTRWPEWEWKQGPFPRADAKTP